MKGRYYKKEEDEFEHNHRFSRMILYIKKKLNSKKIISHWLLQTN